MTTGLAEALLVALGALHFLQLPVTSILMRTTLDLKQELQRLSPLFRRIVRLFIWGLMLLLTGIGGLIAAYPSDVTKSRFGHALCFLLGGLFAARVTAHASLFGAWPAGFANRSAYFALGFLYCVLAGGYVCVGFSVI
jgi:hypothetical protein